MTKVAFCDDDSAVLRELRLLLEQYCADRDEELDCAMFHSPLELIRSMERGAGFDILFLDVLMPGSTGSTRRQRSERLTKQSRSFF